LTIIENTAPIFGLGKKYKVVFGFKRKKANSNKPGDKRRISLLNFDFKIISGLESARLKKTATTTLSPLQFVAGEW
jgi:hypothetical protein